MQNRLPFLSLAALLVLAAGVVGCAGNPSLETARLAVQNQQYDQALVSLNTALAANPEDPAALALKADVLRLQAERNTDPVARQAQVDEMIQTLATIQRVQPNNPQLPLLRLQAWAAEINAGVPLLQADDGAASEPYFRNATRIIPDSANGHFFLGLAEYVQGNADAAIAPLEQTLQLEPGNEDAVVYLSQAYVSAQRGSDAIELLEGASRRSPTNERYRRALLNVYSSTGQTDRALSAYTEQIAATPDDALLRYNYGSLLLAAERYDEAIEQLERGVQIDGSNVDARYNLGAALQNKAKAIQDEAEGLSLNEQARYDALIAERNALLQRAIPQFVAARQGASAQDEPVICEALLIVYNALDRRADAEAVASCAGRAMD